MLYIKRGSNCILFSIISTYIFDILKKMQKRSSFSFSFKIFYSLCSCIDVMASHGKLICFWIMEIGWQGNKPILSRKKISICRSFLTLNWKAFSWLEENGWQVLMPGSKNEKRREKQFKLRWFTDLFQYLPNEK